MTLGSLGAAVHAPVHAGPSLDAITVTLRKYAVIGTTRGFSQHLPTGTLPDQQCDPARE
jgi:hypothetical protein